MLLTRTSAPPTRRMPPRLERRAAADWLLDVGFATPNLELI